MNEYEKRLSDLVYDVIHDNNFSLPYIYKQLFKLISFVAIKADAMIYENVITDKEIFRMLDERLLSKEITRKE